MDVDIPKRFAGHRPPLIRQWNAAWSKTRGPDYFDRIRALLVVHARRVDGKELVIDNGEEIPRCEPVRWRHDVGLAPADELFSNFERQRIFVIGRTEPPDLAERPA